MAVIFPRWTNQITKLFLAGVVSGVLVAPVAGSLWLMYSPWFTDVGYAPVQPVPFSHKLHAGDLGLDCRYCHYTVEKSAKAAVPPTATCMGCHTYVRPKSQKLTLVRTSFKTGKPIPWVRVHMLPDYSFFNHSAHVAAGVGCESCHGRIDKMTVVRQAKPLSMRWCLDCHRDPNAKLRPRNAITKMGWSKKYQPATDPVRKQRKDIQLLRAALTSETNIKPVRMAGKRRLLDKKTKKLSPEKIKQVVVNPPEHCSGCHR